ncbi:TROVE domain-containing protein [Streptosporangium sp. NPDC000396]|uniref:TROVE domain-containing protein n=1 Tax=Streptosporangium sp. NPDC000396 TaxID=3366185 RepID=UPI0036BD8E7D
MATRAPAVVETSRKEMFLLVARALADGHARIPTERFADLATRLATVDDAWLTRLIGWMSRHDALRHLRLAAVSELAHACLLAGTASRSLVGGALQRADEPGELLAYWLRRYGRAIPKPVKRGVADAVIRLYDEPALATYDNSAAQLRFADVLALTHPSPRDITQAAVFGHAVARRRGDTSRIPEALPLLRARRSLYWIAADKRATLLERHDAAETLSRAAMTWQTVQRWLLGGMTGAAWTAVLPTMSYQDRLTHLPDFDRTGVSDEVAARVAALLAEPAAVIRSGVTPLEIMAAMRSVPGSRWSWALREALQLSLANVPALPGRTLVLVDRTDLMSSRADDTATFGAAPRSRCGPRRWIWWSSVRPPPGFRSGREMRSPRWSSASTRSAARRARRQPCAITWTATTGS